MINPGTETFPVSREKSLGNPGKSLLNKTGIFGRFLDILKVIFNNLDYEMTKKPLKIAQYTGKMRVHKQ